MLDKNNLNMQIKVSKDFKDVIKKALFYEVEEIYLK